MVINFQCNFVNLLVLSVNFISGAVSKGSEHDTKELQFASEGVKVV